VLFFRRYYFNCHEFSWVYIYSSSTKYHSVGTLNLTLSGDISGVTTLTATSLAGTITTAAQPTLHL
jgi:hypothetical protein